MINVKAILFQLNQFVLWTSSQSGHLPDVPIVIVELELRVRQDHLMQVELKLVFIPLIPLPLEKVCIIALLKIIILPAEEVILTISNEDVQEVFAHWLELRISPVIILNLQVYLYPLDGHEPH